MCVTVCACVCVCVCVCVFHQVIIQHGGDIVEKYDTLKVTHLLALHKNCPDFDMVRTL